MKLKQEFVLRSVAGENVLIPIVSVDCPFNGIITLNETSAFIWKQIEAGKEKEEIVAAILDEYEVEKSHAEQNVEDFCNQLVKLGIL